AGRRRRGGPVPPRVVARPRHSEPPAHFHDRIVAELRADKRVLRRRCYSFAAKYAAAFLRNSNSIRNSRFSASKSAMCARSFGVNGFSSAGCSRRYAFTQLPKVPSLIPKSAATRAIGRDCSITIETASALYSGEKARRFLDIPIIPSR